MKKNMLSIVTVIALAGLAQAALPVTVNDK